MKNVLQPGGHLACAICPERIIFRNQDQTLNVKNYNEISFLIKRSNMDGFGLMTVGFCAKCVDQARQDMKLFEKISESVKEGWQIEFDQDKISKELQDKYWKDWADMRVVGWYGGGDSVEQKQLQNT